MLSLRFAMFALVLAMGMATAAGSLSSWPLEDVTCVQFVEEHGLPSHALSRLADPGWAFVVPVATSAPVPYYTLPQRLATKLCGSAQMELNAEQGMYMGDLPLDFPPDDTIVVAFRRPTRHGVAVSLKTALQDAGFDAVLAYHPVQWGDSWEEWVDPSHNDSPFLLGAPSYRYRTTLHVLVDDLPHPRTLFSGVVSPNMDILLGGGAAASHQAGDVVALDVACNTLSFANHTGKIAGRVEAVSGVPCVCDRVWGCYHPWGVWGPPQAQVHLASQFPYVSYVYGTTMSTPKEELPQHEDALLSLLRTAPPATAVEQLATAAAFFTCSTGPWGHWPLPGLHHVPCPPSTMTAAAWRALGRSQLLLVKENPNNARLKDVWGAFSGVQQAVPTVQAFNIRLPQHAAPFFPQPASLSPPEASARLAGIVGGVVAAGKPGAPCPTVLPQFAAAMTCAPSLLAAVDAGLDVLVVIPGVDAACGAVAAVSTLLHDLSMSFLVVDADRLAPAAIVAAAHQDIAAGVLVAACSSAHALDVVLGRTLASNGVYFGFVHGEVVSDEEAFNAIAPGVFALRPRKFMQLWLDTLRARRLELGGDAVRATMRKLFLGNGERAPSNIPVYRTRRHVAGDTSILGGGPVYVPQDSPRPTRLKVLQRLVEAKGYSSYLEIGCNDNSTFDRVDVTGLKVGVDPEEGGTHKMTSDAFFDALRGGQLLGVGNGSRPLFDLVFVDGLHEHQQVLRDVTNAFDFLAPGGTVVMHDCSPRDEHESDPERRTLYWNGDTWKAAIELRRHPNLDMATGNFDQGVGVLKRRPNSDPPQLHAAGIGFEEFDARRRELLRLMEWDELMAWAVAEQ